MVFGWVLVAYGNDLFWEPRNGIREPLAEVCAVLLFFAAGGVLAFSVWAAPSLVLLSLLVLALLVLSIESRRGVNPNLVWHGPRAD